MSGIIEKLRLAQISACTCMTKTPDVSWHDVTCRYRVLSEAVEAITMQTNLIASLRAELTKSYTFDLGEPGGDYTVQWSAEEVKALSGTSTKLEFNKLDDKSQRMRKLLDIVAGAEPICSFCFQRGCNGECHGDDMMGGCD